ncbi:MAG: B12-binding domain-containing radical SAM protein [Phycisphaerae bacterium]|nr:B12-binding domain-containing radical SAM protein [Phycisphaerae bacterium]
MRILLVQPEYQISGFGFRLAAMPEPLHLELLAASVPDHDVRIFDMRIDANLLGKLESFQPNVVAVTALTTEVYVARDVLMAVKKFSDEIFTVVGGHHATLMPEDFRMPQVDAISLGEGEFSFPHMIEAVDEGKSLAMVPNLIWRNRDGHFVSNGRTIPPGRSMDDLPLPRRDLVEKYREEYFFLFDKPDSSVAASRGCPYRCNFCSVHEFYEGKTRHMSAERVLDEIHHCDTKHITFVDDNFMMNYRRENALADLIKAEGVDMSFSMECRTDSIVRHPELVEKWVDIGLYAVLLGLEGASDKALAGVNKENKLSVNDEAIKILKANGVIIWGAFITDPQWTTDDFAILRDYVDEKEITHTQFTILTPLPGTQLYRQQFNDLLTYDYTCYDTLHAVTPTKMPRVEFYKNFAKLYQQADLGPYYDLVREGKLTVDDCRRGKRMLDAMSHWEYYLENDPVIGSVRAKSEALPGAFAHKRSRARFA